MPAEQQRSVYKTAGGYGIRWYDETGARRRRAGFSSRSDARRWFQDVERHIKLNAYASTRSVMTDDLSR